MIDAYDIARLGLSAALAPFAHRVEVVSWRSLSDLSTNTLDVVLYEPIGLQPEQRALVQRLSDVHGVAPIIYSWRDGATARAGQLRISKRLSPGDLVPLLESIAEENRRTRRASGDGTAAVTGRADQEHGDWELTVRELEVLGMVGEGLTNQEICERLYLSINSVKTHIRTAYRKIGVQRRSQAVAWALDHGLGENLAAMEQSRQAASNGDGTGP